MSTAIATRTFANRRSATDLLRKLGIKPYQYETLIKPAGGKFLVIVGPDGRPVPPLELLAATAEVAEALVAAEVAKQVAPASKEVTAKREKQVKQLATRYQRAEAAAVKAKAPKPKKPKPVKKKASKPRIPKVKVKAVTPEPPVGAVEAVVATKVGPACLELYLQGKTSLEVWLIVRKKFKLTDDQRTYPSWYQSHYRRAGQLPPAKEKK